MRESSLVHLVCPACKGGLRIADRDGAPQEPIETGRLACTECGAGYPIVSFIPRFVPVDNYASGFGLEWTRHARTQYDSYSGIPASEERFFRETGWSRRLDGEILLEVGSGSGRFTEHAAATGAFVISMDYSYAVEANYGSNGRRENVLIVQADVYQMPFRDGYFDRVFCFGMLQHTPDVRRAFGSLGPMLKRGGHLVVDVYNKAFRTTWWATKTYVRPLTRRMRPDTLYGLVRRWTDVMWPVARVLRRIPRLGETIAWHLLIADYSSWGLSDDRAREWAYLDLFDMLAPRYDSPQTLETMRRWFREEGYLDVEVEYGYNGVEGRGRKG